MPQPTDDLSQSACPVGSDLSVTPAHDRSPVAGMAGSCANWTRILSECKHLIGSTLLDEQGRQWVFFGVLDAPEDYYYHLEPAEPGSCGPTRLFSCVGSLQTHGFRSLTQQGCTSGNQADLEQGIHRADL